MAGCRIVEAGVSNAVTALATTSTSYKTAGDTLVTALNSAIADMEGAAKDAFKALIDKDIAKFVQEDLPKAITDMSNLLEQNKNNFITVDQQIADSISGN